MKARLFFRLLRLAAPFRWWMALSALLGFATIGSSIGLMSTAAWIIASAALHPPISELQIAIVGVRFFGIARGVFRYLERYVSHQTTFRLLARLRVWFYEQIEPLAPARLEQHRGGDLLSRAVADMETLQNVYLRVIAPPAVAVLVGVVMMIFMGAFDVWLAAALVFFLLLAGVGLPLLARALSRHAAQRLVTTRSELNAAWVDGIQGLADLLAYDAADRHAARLRALSRELGNQQARLAWTGALNTALGSLAVSLATLAVLLIAVPLVRAGQLDGVLLAVLALATITSFEAVLPLPAAFQQLDSSLEAARRLFDLADTPPAVLDPPAALHLPPTEKTAPGLSLTVENLRFRYAPDAPPALDGISFSLPPGGTLAVVGASGAGKSTLVNLLLRFWDYHEGQITLGGLDVRALPQDEVRAHFAVVSQRTHLFNGTIRDNLRLARPDATDDELAEAAARAHLHDFITALPQGYQTRIGEQGLRLSGGERQRLAIARAVLKAAPILVLDEATAHLDALTERAVLNTIRAALPGQTTLIITHRLVGLDTAGEILVLRAGQVIERGRHADLLAHDGPYRRLWDLQNQILPPDNPTP